MEFFHTRQICNLPAAKRADQILTHLEYIDAEIEDAIFPSVTLVTEQGMNLWM